MTPDGPAGRLSFAIVGFLGRGRYAQTLHGDLIEGYVEIQSTAGTDTAGRWLRRQLFAATTALLRRRLVTEAAAAAKRIGTLWPGLAVLTLAELVASVCAHRPASSLPFAFAALAGGYFPGGLIAAALVFAAAGAVTALASRKPVLFDAVVLWIAVAAGGLTAGGMMLGGHGSWASPLRMLLPLAFVVAGAAAAIALRRQALGWTAAR